MVGIKTKIFVLKLRVFFCNGANRMTDCIMNRFKAVSSPPLQVLIDQTPVVSLVTHEVGLKTEYVVYLWMFILTLMPQNIYCLFQLNITCWLRNLCHSSGSYLRDSQH